jgi:hypothetical protein
MCHVPPGNPDNFHTITISENAVEAHLAHGDLPGSCDESCEQLCDDGDLCSVDDCAVGGGCDNSGATDCDDSEECTIDRCDSTLGCMYDPVGSGVSCDDGMPCTYPDMCDGSGECAGEDDLACCLPGDPDGRCDDENECTTVDECVVPAGEDKGACSNSGDVMCIEPPCSTSTCNPLTGVCDPTYLCEAPDACSGVECVNDDCVPTGGCVPPPCKIPVCDDMNGVCSFPDRVCPEGTACNPNTDVCEAVTVMCPCWTAIGYDSLESLWGAAAPPNCGRLDLCEDITSSAGLQSSRANCVAVDTRYQLMSYVRDAGIGAPVGKRYRCIFIIRAAGQPNQNPTVYLDDPAEFAVCLAEHDAFTATTDFPVPPETRHQDPMCGLPTPGSP